MLRPLCFARLFFGWLLLFLTGCQTAVHGHSEAGKTFASVMQQAQRGDAEAQLRLAGFYSMGEGVEKNYPLSARWLTRAAQQGNVAAQGILAAMYYEGLGVPQDYSQARHWATKAAWQGDTTAQSLLGMMYMEGKGFAQDYQQAYAWLALAAVNGDKPETQNRDAAATQLSPQELQQAQQQATAMTLKIIATGKKMP